MPSETITEEQRKYLGERGFAVIEGSPLKTAPFPYVKLLPIGGLHATIEYHHNHVAVTTTGGNCNPTNMGIDELVGIIELMAGTSMQKKGHSFATGQGKPINVYMQDPVWREVAERLMEKYPLSL